MAILGIETSGRIASVAVKTAAGIHELTGSPDVSTSSSLLDDCRRAVEQSGLSITDLERIAVGLGPGSFTGIRLGCTAAKGLAWSLDIEAGGVCTFQALAAWIADREELTEGTVCVLADARMQEAFLGRYAVAVDGVTEEALDLLPVAELSAALPQAATVAGPGVGKYGQELKAARDDLTVLLDTDAPPARFVISEAERTAHFARPLEKDIEPMYLKASEPERRTQRQQWKG